MKTMLNIKLDKSLKERAQRVAKDLGLPLSTVVNNYLREFVQERRIVFTDHPMPNTRTRKVLDAALKDVEEGKNLSPVFDDVEDFLKHLGI